MEEETTRVTTGRLIQEAYSEQALTKLKAIPFTAADQERCTADYARLHAEVDQLTAEGADPGGPEAQAMARLSLELLQGFTQNDPDVESGLKRYHELASELPDDQKPMAARPKASEEFLERARALYRERNSDWKTLRPPWFKPGGTPSA